MKDRYSRQTVLPEIGKEGQEKVREGSIAIIGLGGLGTTMAEVLTRAGIGELQIVDRDFVEVSNLHRQSLYKEEDLGRSKAEVAAERLEQINSEVEFNPKVVHVDSHNIEEVIEDVDLVLDGTDNMKVRYIINDACVKHEVPWIYSAVIGTYGMSLNIIPEEGPCLYCLQGSKPEAGTLETCATAGVLPTVPRIIGNMAATEALKFLVDKPMRKELLIFDPWGNDYKLEEVSKREDCRCCGKKEFPYIQARRDRTAQLCGREAIQVLPGEDLDIDLEKIVERYEDAEQVGEFMVKISLDEYEMSLFKDGRLIVIGTNDKNKALSLYSEYLGR